MTLSIADRVTPYRDSPATFAFYAEAHKAAVVCLEASGIVPTETARVIAKTLGAVLREHESPGSALSLDYVDLEARMIARMGPTASLLHLGRSRQDLLSAANRNTLRDGLQSVLAELVDARGAILLLAEQHRSTVIPRYTHGVPAQPTTFGHYLLAYSEAFARLHDDVEAAYRVVNRSPLGAAVLATSRFPIDRDRVAHLLGFEGIVENSYGANHVAPIDAIQSALHPLVVLALHVSQFAQDVSAEQPVPHPWLTVRSGELTGESSAMPQKRNPLVLEYLRKGAARILGAANTMTFLAHNASSGMTDSRDSVDLYPAEIARDLLEMLAATVRALDVDQDEAEQRASADYSTMTDVADLLFEQFAVPFRTGHRFASLLSDHGRAAGVDPASIPHAEVESIYRMVTGEPPPFDAAGFARAVSAREFVASRRGRGGPAAAEVDRMLTAHVALLEAHRHRVASIMSARQAARADLDAAFEALLTVSPTAQKEI